MERDSHSSKSASTRKVSDRLAKEFHRDADKRKAGIVRAADKIINKEESELDELSKDALSNYARTASSRASTMIDIKKERKGKAKEMKKQGLHGLAKVWKDGAKDAQKTINKRVKGVAQATQKMSYKD